MPDGTYCVTITDANACETDTCFDVLPGAVSTNEIEDLISFTIAPNPVTQNKLFIDLDFSNPKNIGISLLNSFGQTVYYSQFLDFTNSTIRLDMRDYSAGVYFVKIESLEDNKMIVRKILK